MFLSIYQTMMAQPLELVIDLLLFFHFLFSMDKDGSLKVDWNEWRNYLLLHPSSDLRDIYTYWKHASVRRHSYHFSFWFLWNFLNYSPPFEWDVKMLAQCVMKFMLRPCPIRRLWLTAAARSRVSRGTGRHNDQAVAEVAVSDTALENPLHLL